MLGYAGAKVWGFWYKAYDHEAKLATLTLQLQDVVCLNQIRGFTEQVSGLSSSAGLGCAAEVQGSTQPLYLYILNINLTVYLFTLNHVAPKTVKLSIRGRRA